MVHNTCYDAGAYVASVAWLKANILVIITISLQATLTEFPRSSIGLLGFGINEAGVVQKVDGLARSVGLQKNSRLLQV